MSETPDQKASTSSACNTVGWIGRVVGVVLAVGIYVGLQGVAGLTDEGRSVAAVGMLMAVYWMTEALPLPVTSLLPLVLFPLLGVLSFTETASPYADKFIFLFMGGFMIAQAIWRWDLHRRFALVTVLAAGTQPVRLIGGFMVATAFMSMWISNTASTMLMLPIALSTIRLVNNENASESETDRGSNNFATCLLLGIAYAASIGGVATLIGTPPNAFLAGFLEEKGVAIGFGQWMAVGFPLAVVFLVITWFLLTRWIYPVHLEKLSGGRRLIRSELTELGPISRGQWTVLCVFLLTAMMWIVRGPLTNSTWVTDRFPPVANLNDAMIAMGGALLLFLIPVDFKRGVFALDWETARRLPWGVLLLFGGGLSLAKAVARSDLDQWIGQLVGGLGGLPTVLIVAAVVVIVIFLTEITSNFATAATFLPILYPVAVGLEIQPMVLLVPATLAASCAFMLPVATPPNAIVFGSQRVTIAQMVRAGFWLNLIGAVLIVLFMYTWIASVLGVRL